MASKNEELLAGNGIEEILAVIDNDILVEPNDLEIGSSAQLKFPKYRILI